MLAIGTSIFLDVGDGREGSLLHDEADVLLPLQIFPRRSAFQLMKIRNAHVAPASQSGRLVFRNDQASFQTDLAGFLIAQNARWIFRSGPSAFQNCALAFHRVDDRCRHCCCVLGGQFLGGRSRRERGLRVNLREVAARNFEADGLQSRLQFSHKKEL